MDISIILPLHRAKKMFTLICVIIFFILQGCGNLQKQDDDVMTNDSLAIGLCRQLEGDGTPFWLVISSILLFTGCAAGILFIKKRRSPQTVNSQEGKIYETEAYLRFKDQSKHPQQIITKEDWKALEVQFSWTSPFRICIHDASNY